MNVSVWLYSLHSEVKAGASRCSLFGCERTGTSYDVPELSAPRHFLRDVSRYSCIIFSGTRISYLTSSK